MIYIGKTVNIKPTYEGCGSDAPMQGKVVYIHPEHRFYCAEFATLRGSFRECFPCPASMRKSRMPNYIPERRLWRK